MKMVLLLIASLFAATVHTATLERGAIFPLWPGAAPGSEGVTAPESYGPADAKLPRRFDVVHYPSVYAFLPRTPASTRAAVVIVPGGGHFWLNMAVDGWPIADWANQQGVAAFVVKYRLAKAKDSHYTIEGEELADVTRAMRLVRYHAGEWGIDPGKIGLIGLSAGGEVAGLELARFDRGDPAARDAIERISSRPDFAVLVYPGANDLTPVVSHDAPKTFLVCADDDHPHAVNTVNYYQALAKENVSSEIHIFASGAHGFGMKPVKHPVAQWPQLLRAWMVDTAVLE